MRDSKIGLRRTNFFLDDLYSVILKGCYVASMNFGEVISVPCILKMNKDSRVICVGMISVRPVVDAGELCKEV